MDNKSKLETNMREPTEEEYNSISKYIEEISTSIEPVYNGSFSVARFKNNELEILYEYINNLNEAYLLAQLEMDGKYVIVILPGWNINIKTDKYKYNKALELAKIYKIKEEE